MSELVAAKAGLCALLAGLALAGCASTRPTGSAATCGPAGEAAGLYDLESAPFGRAERGWATYAPAVSAELKVPCPPGTPAFAAALGRWQGERGLAPTGTMDAATLEALKTLWQSRRPFLAVRARDICPDPPPEAALAAARADETAGRPMQLRKRALKAYRKMRAAAARQVPEVAADPKLLRIFSSYRSPAYDDARCTRDRNCDGVARAQCSSHRTGLVVDLAVGAAPGFTVDSSNDANRLFQARGAAYRWLVANGPRYGFVNYVFEPWHWEWTGEPVVVP